MFESIEKRFRRVVPHADYWSLRCVREQSEYIHVRRDVLEPVLQDDDTGVMITVIKGNGIGYGATCDLTSSGLRTACDSALQWARICADAALPDIASLPLASKSGNYRSPVEISWDQWPLKEKIQLLQKMSLQLKIGDEIVDWNASLWNRDVEHLFCDSEGTRIEQGFALLAPGLSVHANKGTETLRRSYTNALQRGMECLASEAYESKAPLLAEEAIQLLHAPDCPSGHMDILVDPDQMMLQIHESVGHPLELDRILGDERNYAGTTFVTPEMIGTYPYGSPLMNITFDPTIPGEFASYGFDDDGSRAKKAHIIEKGILKRALGGRTSQYRSDLPGVANARASSWNRPPIDRMANLNMPPGDSSFDEMVGAIEKGVYLKTNRSWSIDDSRNKFQFGCEWARRIENGELKEVVKKPNYRGISSKFWRSLKMVGNEATFQVWGLPNCGKGEPSQAMRVGHAAPVCLFKDVEVFGGES